MEDVIVRKKMHIEILSDALEPEGNLSQLEAPTSRATQNNV